jgi:hypothetical protein
MRIEMRVERNGRSIFRAEYYTEVGLSFAEYSKMALKELHRQHPEVLLLDDDVWLKFDKVSYAQSKRRRRADVIGNAVKAMRKVTARKLRFASRQIEQGSC